MSELKKINEEFERSIQAQIEGRLDMRDGQVVVVRRFPPPHKIPMQAYRDRQERLQVEIVKNLPRR